MMFQKYCLSVKVLNNFRTLESSKLQLESCLFLFLEQSKVIVFLVDNYQATNVTHFRKILDMKKLCSYSTCQKCPERAFPRAKSSNWSDISKKSFENSTFAEIWNRAIFIQSKRQFLASTWRLINWMSLCQLSFITSRRLQTLALKFREIRQKAYRQMQSKAKFTGSKVRGHLPFSRE